MTKVIIRDGNYTDENYYYLLSNEQVALLNELNINHLLSDNIFITYLPNEDFKEVK